MTKLREKRPSNCWRGGRMPLPCICLAVRDDLPVEKRLAGCDLLEPIWFSFKYPRRPWELCGFYSEGR